jgi:hypothetical protein
VRRIHDAGGTVDFVVLDQPFAAGHLAVGCAWSKQRIARQLDGVVAGLEKVFPDVQVGEVEALTAWAKADDLEAWIPTAITSRLAFFHLQPDFARKDWTAGAMEIETACGRDGLPFGVVYSGTGSTDQAVAGSVQDRVSAYEVKAGATPSQVVFQPAPGEPSRLLPEAQPDTITWAVDRYFRTRSHLDIEIGPSQFVGSDRVNGILSDAAGTRIAGAPVAITMTRVGSDGSLGSVFDLGIRTTDEQGAFQLTFHPPGLNLHLGKVLIEAWFPGDDRYWPAYRSGTTTE